MSKKQKMPSFEGMAEVEAIKKWFSELLETLQSSADETNTSGTVRMTLVITAYPQNKSEESEQI